ncbi:MAG: hypothetical protein ACLFN0_01505 [Thermovirgaceae bacterium]
MIPFDSAIAGALLERKINTYSASRMGTALSKAGRMKKKHQDFARAKETVQSQSVEAEIADLEARIQKEIDALHATSGGNVPVEEIVISPKAGDLSLRLFGIIWLPWKRTAGGGLEHGWKGQ